MTEILITKCHLTAYPMGPLVPAPLVAGTDQFIYVPEAPHCRGPEARKDLLCTVLKFFFGYFPQPTPHCPNTSLLWPFCPALSLVESFTFHLPPPPPERIIMTGSRGLMEYGVHCSVNVFRVIESLVEASGRKTVEAPYRESALTWMLRNSFGGITALIAPVACFEQHLMA